MHIVQNKQIDEQLITQAKQGRRAAFDLLVLRYQHRVAKLISHTIKDPHETLDVVQETFIRAYRSLESFRGDSSFYTWLFRIAINTAKNHQISKTKRPPDTDIDFLEAEHLEEGHNLNENATPEHLIYCDEMQQSVAKSLEAMPEELRSAIMLREMDGLSYEEISLIMECPIGTVRSRIFRARELLDESIRPYIDH